MSNNFATSVTLVEVGALLSAILVFDYKLPFTYAVVSSRITMVNQYQTHGKNHAFTHCHLCHCQFYWMITSVTGNLPHAVVK